MYAAEIALESVPGLTVRSFSVREALSAPFEVSAIVRSPDPDIDLTTVVGKAAAFVVRSDVLGSTALGRTLTGVCRSFEQLSAERTGLSIYQAVIVPELELLALRQNCRIYQHRTVPQIAQALLAEWGIEPKLSLTLDHPPLEYVTQYGESDLAFLSRLLERAGISYRFEFSADEATKLVLVDEPTAGKAAVLLPYRDRPTPTDLVFASHVRLAHNVRPGKVSIRDYDFRRKVDFPLVAKSAAASAPEDRYELYAYEPGAFLVETSEASTAASDDQGVARHVPAFGDGLAQRALDAARRGKRLVGYRTGAIDLAPGKLFAVEGYPREDVGDDDVLLVTESWISGGDGEEWQVGGEAHFCADAFQPLWRTARPRISGVQSAFVVGPKGGNREIHVDEFGRVRVEFQWDRESQRDDKSSCWLRVSQAWAGSGFGTMHIPRIGEEVLVAFFEGDPDQPVVVGRAHDAREVVPYRLPEHDTRSTWRSDSTPQSNGYNEIRFEDARGREHVYVQAQRNLIALVKNNETERTGKSRLTVVGKSRGSIVSGSDALLVGEKYSLQMVEPPDDDALKIHGQMQPDVTPLPTKVEMVHDKLSATSGKAHLLLDDEDVVLECKGSLGIKGKNIVIEGGPNVKIN